MISTVMEPEGPSPGKAEHELDDNDDVEDDAPEEPSTGWHYLVPPARFSPFNHLPHR